MTTERAQAHLIGAVMLFGILLALLALVQLTAVPGWNQAVEIQHNERVQDDLVDLGADLATVGGTDRSQSTVIELGVRYPPRPFLFNPPDSTGTLATTAPEPFRIENVDIADVDNYWAAGSADEGTIAATTRAIAYRPTYRVYDGAPATRYELGVVYNEFEDRLFIAREGFLDGRRLSLVTVAGEFNRSGVDSESVAVVADSAPANAVSITNRTSEPITVTVPTRLTEGEWESLLENEFESNGGHVRNDAGGISVADGNLTVVLESGVDYQLRLSRVRLEPPATPADPRYVTHLDGGTTRLRPLEAERLVFEVRDELNNPVAGEHVDVSATDGFIGTASGRSGTDGQFAVRYVAPPSSGTETVTATIDANDDGDVTDPGEAGTVEVTVTNATTRGGDFADANPAPNSGRVWVSSATGDGTTANITLNNDGNTDMTLRSLRLPFMFSDDTNPPPASGTFAYDGYTKVLEIPGPFETVQGPTLGPDGDVDDTATIQIRDLKNNLKDDFIVMIAVWQSGTGEVITQSYIVGIVD